MKFTVEQSVLVDGVNWVSRSLSTRPIKTELLGIVIDATHEEIHLSASDLETASKAHFPAEIKEGGKVLVPGRLLAEISRSLPNKPITFVLEGTRVLVTSGSAKFTLPTLSIDEYPKLPELPDTTGVIASDLFSTAVSQVAIAAGRDDSLPTLTAIHRKYQKTPLYPQLIPNWGQVPLKGRIRAYLPHLLLNPVGQLCDLVINRSALGH